MKLLVLIICSLGFITLALGAEPASFELRAVADSPSTVTQEFILPTHNGGTAEKILLDSAILLDATAVRSAAVESEPGGAAGVSITLTDTGAKRFAEITTEHVGQRLAIILDGQVRSAPVVRQAILGGSLTISGNFTPEEALDLAQKVNAAITHKPAP